MHYADLRPRVVTATILIASLCALEMLHQSVPEFRPIFPIVAVLLVALCSKEFVFLCQRDGNKFAVWYHSIPFVSASVFLLSMYPLPMTVVPNVAASRMLASGVCGLLVALILCALSGRRSLEEVRITSAEVFLCAILLGLGGTGLISLALMPTHALLYTMVGIVIANDTGAYFVGKKFGRRKLSIFISPGKSIEGTCGGLLSGLIVGLLLGSSFTTFGLFELIALTLLVGISSQCTDLAKSFVKRIYGAKDSGTLLPGHGGLLDRLDGVLGGGIALHIFIALIYG